LLYVAAVLEREKHVVRVLDTQLNENATKVAEDVALLRPDIIGITATTPQITLALAIAGEIKKRLKVPVVLGGVHPTVMPEETLGFDSVDFVVLGEGEETMPELCRRIQDGESVSEVKGIGYKRHGKLRFTSIRPLIEELDDVPFPARHHLRSRWYFAPPRMRGVWTKSTATIITSRGCPFQCLFCSSHLMFGRRVRRRSPENVVEELEHLRHEFGIDSIWFVDDTFTVDQKWVMQFCDLLIKKGLHNLVWGCQARADTLEPYTLQLMKQAGCVQVDIGVESGSDRVLKILKKGITVEQIEKAFKICKEAGVQTFASFILGTPGETSEDIKKTEALIDKITPDYSEFFYATPYPGTDLYVLAQKHGVFDKDIPYHQWLASKQTDKPIMTIGVTQEELIRTRSRLHNKVIWRNYRTMLRRPKFIVGGISIFVGGVSGLPNGFLRFSKTGKIDSILVEVLRKYRERMKNKLSVGF
jgi:radical SAM superfamily enzyme YgiQ (UPF0313 family)